MAENLPQFSGIEISKLFEKPPFFEDSKNIQFLSEKQDLDKIWIP